jgi:lysophospholipase L1-like esterase
VDLYYWRACLLALAWGVALGATARAAEPQAESGRLVLSDGDRVVLLGGTFIEREQSYGYLEAALVSRYPGKNIVVRNLGWSGDTVWGEARAGFGGPADGFNQLKASLQAVAPTVIIVAYGANEAFAAAPGLGRFAAGLEALLDALAATKARVVLLSPLEHENHGPPLPDPAGYNEDVKQYADAMSVVAAKRGLPYVNLLKSLCRADTPTALWVTDNGVHLTAFGYWRAAPKILAGLGMPDIPWLVDLDGTKVVASTRATVSAVERTGTGLKFRVRDEYLPEAKAPDGTPELSTVNRAGQRTLRVRGLVGGHLLRIDGREIESFNADEWAQGVVGMTGPDIDQAERLRRQIVAKNELYFHRWRPQNETYLLGFRKGEQGNNAVEIPQFDPMVTSKEARIRELTVPLEHVYELIQK